MNDFTKLFADMMEQGQKMAASFNPSLENLQMPDLQNMMPKMTKEQMELLWGNAFNKDGLDAKTRLLVMLAGLTAQGAQAELPFKLTTRHALEAGASEKEITEVIYQMSMLGGLPAMSKAMEMAQAIFTEFREDSA